jgi:hypothetical protein
MGNDRPAANEIPEPPAPASSAGLPLCEGADHHRHSSITPQVRGFSLLARGDPIVTIGSWPPLTA